MENMKIESVRIAYAKRGGQGGLLESNPTKYAFCSQSLEVGLESGIVNRLQTTTDSKNIPSYTVDQAVKRFLCLSIPPHSAELKEKLLT